MKNAPFILATVTAGVAGRNQTMCLISKPGGRLYKADEWLKNHMRCRANEHGSHPYFHGVATGCIETKHSETSEGEDVLYSIMDGGWKQSGHWSNPRWTFSGMAGGGSSVYCVTAVKGKSTSAIYYEVTDLKLYETKIKVVVESWRYKSTYKPNGTEEIGTLLGHLQRSALNKRQEYERSYVYLTNFVMPRHKAPFNFKYNEYDIWSFAEAISQTIGGIPPLGMHSAGLSAAYLAAIDDIPQNSVNMLESVMDTASMIMSIKEGPKALRKLSRFKDPREIWLTYRYCLKTGQLDAQELTRFAQAVSACTTMQHIKVHGTYRRGDILYRASGTIASSVLINDTVESARAILGLDPSAADVWDIVPYSFIVDWFLGIGNLLETVDLMGTACTSQVTDVWYSYETSYDGQTCYARLGGGNGGLIGLPYLTNRDASKKTILMRVTDSLALFG